MYAIPVHLVLIALLTLGFVFDKPRLVSFENISFESFEPVSQTICLRYNPVFHNSRPMALNLNSIEAEVWMDNIYMGKMENPLSERVDADAAHYLDLCQDLKVENLDKVLAYIDTHPKFDIKIKGQCTYSCFGISMDAAYEHKEIVKASVMEAVWNGSQYAFIK
jgi:LEA14-like dessication related protein